MTLQEAFEQVEDHRSGPAQRYDLKEMIIMSICAVLCGADSWVDVADWCEEEEGWLRKFLVLANGTPSHDTFGVEKEKIISLGFEKEEIRLLCRFLCDPHNKHAEKRYLEYVERLR